MLSRPLPVPAPLPTSGAAVPGGARPNHSNPPVPGLPGLPTPLKAGLGPMLGGGGRAWIREYPAARPWGRLWPGAWDWRARVEGEREACGLDVGGR